MAVSPVVRGDGQVARVGRRSGQVAAALGVLNADQQERAHGPVAHRHLDQAGDVQEVLSQAAVALPAAATCAGASASARSAARQAWPARWLTNGNVTRISTVAWTRLRADAECTR